MNSNKFASNEEWSNYAAYGYAIEAAKNADFPDEQITKLIRYMHRSFDLKTIDEAEKIYTSSKY